MTSATLPPNPSPSHHLPLQSAMSCLEPAVSGSETLPPCAPNHIPKLASCDDKIEVLCFGDVMSGIQSNYVSHILAEHPGHGTNIKEVSACTEDGYSICAPASQRVCLILSRQREPVCRDTRSHMHAANAIQHALTNYRYPHSFFARRIYVWSS